MIFRFWGELAVSKAFWLVGWSQLEIEIIKGNKYGMPNVIFNRVILLTLTMQNPLRLTIILAMLKHSSLPHAVSPSPILLSSWGGQQPINQLASAAISNPNLATGAENEMNTFQYTSILGQQTVDFLPLKNRMAWLPSGKV